MDLQEFAREQAQTLAPLLEQLNRSLWDFAEFGYQEFRSSKEIARVLEEEGFQVELGVGGIPTAIRASSVRRALPYPLPRCSGRTNRSSR